MGQKLVVGPVTKGLKTNVLPFNIDNDSFPTILNAYQWRGRVKRKRGTTPLTRLQRVYASGGGPWTGGNVVSITLDGSGRGNLLTGFSLQSNGSIIPGTVTIADLTSGINYTDPTKDGYLTPTGTGGPNQIDYANGSFVIPAAAGDIVIVSFIYNPSLPVMGLEDLLLNPTQTPGTIAFDTTYSYNISTNYPFSSNDVSFYKNPATGSYPGYIQKTIFTPLTWNGQNYQQFWTTNYEGALWATNGVTVPFVSTNVGMQFSGVTAVQVLSPTTVNILVTGPNLVVGDFVFLNEFDPALVTGINFQSGYVIAGSAPGVITVKLPFASLAGPGGGTTKGIVQYLTNRSDPTRDCLRFYDGDPTDGNPTSPTFLNNFGWVNFCPPLSQFDYSISELPARQYYLVGAKMILPFKDRLLFFGPIVQTSDPVPNPIYLQDTIIYSQNGTPYYTASYTNKPSATKDTPTSPFNVFNPILVPVNKTATSPAFFEDQTGFGGFLQVGIADAFISVSPNEDVLICGFNLRQGRLVYSGNDIDPFSLFIINSELGTSSTFSLINMNEGVITKGNRGYIMTRQVGADRIDLEIPDQVFQVSLLNNGNERVSAQRDYINEWIFFTYPSNEISYIFPTETLLYNYRDNSYALFRETYTTYGSFIRRSGQTWLTLNPSLTWATWNTPWDSGESTTSQPAVIAGNQQGYIVFRSEKTSGTNEAPSLYIQSFLGNTVTCPNHCLNDGDYILITGAIGTIGSQVNGKIFSIFAPTTNTFSLNPSINSTGSDYFGGAVIQRMYVPFIQTKQFPLAWDIGRKTRIGQQQYLFTSTPNGQCTVQIYLSQNADSPYNIPPIVPSTNSVNNSLIYNTVVFTSPEKYIQNCTSISLGNIGNGLLTSFTFNYFDIFDITTTSIVPGSVIIAVGGRLGSVAAFFDNGVGGFNAVGTGTSIGSSIDYTSGVIVISFSSAPTNQPTFTTFQYYLTNLIAPTSGQQAQIWHRMNTSLIGDTVQLGFTFSDDQMRDPTFSNQFTEFELHGMILDVQPAQVLV